MNAKKIVLLCLVLATAIAVSSVFPDVAATTTTTGVWVISTFSGYNQTRTFAYPGKVNATLAPENITVSGQRVVTISDAANTSRVYFSTTIGFYPAGTNFTTGTVNFSWVIPSTLQNGGLLQLAVGLSGVKTPESFVILTIQQNFTNAVINIIGPLLQVYQDRLNAMQQQLNSEKAARADDNFHNQQIEAIMGIALACMTGYIIYDRRKKSGRKDEVERAAGEFEQVVIGTAVENAEPGERARVETVASGGAADKAKGA